jgi:uncharacterized protein YbaR (Trm112 family)
MKIEMICPVCKTEIKIDSLPELTFDTNNTNGIFYIIESTGFQCSKCKQVYHIQG